MSLGSQLRINRSSFHVYVRIAAMSFTNCKCFILAVWTPTNFMVVSLWRPFSFGTCIKIPTRPVNIKVTKIMHTLIKTANLTVVVELITDYPAAPHMFVSSMIFFAKCTIYKAPHLDKKSQHKMHMLMNLPIKDTRNILYLSKGYKEWQDTLSRKYAIRKMIQIHMKTNSRIHYIYVYLNISTPMANLSA